MNLSKKINVNFSSLVGLKAELLRKQTEIKDAKAKEDGQAKLPKPKVKSKKMKDKKPKVEPGYTEIEDVATLKKSKIMLEAKSMLYDKLKKTGGDDTRNYLVDFANKSDESEDEFYNEEDYEDANSDPEDDWVEYKDCFGRTRKCLRRDLPKMREKDNLVKRDITKEPATEEKRERTPEPPVVVQQKEPEIEIMRKKWEEQMERLADKTDIHYQDVLFDEARAHGVGYYAFSQNEEERAKQQENLAKLRKETEQRQREMQEVRDLKSKMEFNRLKSAMIRRRVRAGLSAELPEEEEAALQAQIKLRNSNDAQDAEKDANDPEASKASSTQETRVDNSLIVVEDKIKAFGELLGKRPKWHEMSQEEWVYKRRKDRLGEFAPVYENFRRSGYLKGNRDNQVIPRDGEGDDPVRINAAGPEPTDVWESAAPVCRDDDVIIDEEKINVKSEECAESSIHKEDQVINEGSEKRNDEDEDDDDDDLIGPLPPAAFVANSTPPTFINSFVPQPIATAPSLPVSFDCSVPPPPIMNFSLPPPSMVPSILSVPPPPIATHNVNCAKDGEDSSDSDDSIIIGPVPPPSVASFSNTPPQNCGPSLIDNNHINMFSEIPLPAAVQFPTIHNYSTTSAQLPETERSSESPPNPASNLDVSSISAGLKFLRQKFETTHDS